MPDLKKKIKKCVATIRNLEKEVKEKCKILHEEEEKLYEILKDHPQEITKDLTKYMDIHEPCNRFDLLDI